MRTKDILRLCTLAIIVPMMVLSQGKPPPRPKRTRLPIEVRRAAIDPAALGALRLVPTFNCISVAYGAAEPRANLSLEWRKADTDDAWRRMEYGCVWFEDVRNYRGSVYGLAEDTAYAVRLVADGKVLASGAARTWASAVPVARTIEIDPETARYPIVVSDQGTPEGWVRYTAKAGATLRSTTTAPVFVFTNAAYVTLDDAIIRGGRGTSAIELADGHHIRIRNCDIADWGRDDVQPRYDQNGGLFGPWNEKKRRYLPGNHSGGIDIKSGASGVVVERCWIHDAHSRAHAWRYSHPYGPMGIRLSDSGGNIVLRWNDIVGSDFHRWDDGIGGGNDFYEKGTFNRDSDVSGNFIVFANDDALEIDGGQQNVRVFGNRMEGSFMGVSVQGAVVSPSYVFDNVFSGCEEEFDAAGSSIKLSGIDVYGYGPTCYIFDNVLWGRGGALYPGQTQARMIVRRNRLHGPEQAVKTHPKAPYFDFTADNATNLPSGSCPAAGNWPKRPVPYVLDTSRIDAVRLTAGVVTPCAVQVKLSCGGAGYRMSFKVCANDDMDWFAVSPAAGVVESSKGIVFTVTFDPARMAGRRMWRGAFLVRTADGFSRPVTLYAETDHVPPFKAEKPSETAIYAAVDPANPYREYSFDVPKDGRYYFMLRARRRAGAAGKETVSVKVDGDEADFSTLQNHAWPTWMILAPGGTYMGWIRYYDFKAGRHTLTLAPGAGESSIEGLVLTDSPGSFEPQ